MARDESLNVNGEKSQNAGTSQTKHQLQSQKREGKNLPYLQPTQPHDGEKPLLKCGPLLRYLGTEYGSEGSEGASKEGASTWRGSILIVLGVPGHMKGREESEPPVVMYTGGIVQERDERRSSRRSTGSGSPITENSTMKVVDSQGVEKDGHVTAYGGRAGEVSRGEGGEGDEGVALEGESGEHRPAHSQRSSIGGSSSNNTGSSSSGGGQRRRKRHLVKAKPTMIMNEENTIFWRYNIELSLEPKERMVEYFIHGLEGGPEDDMPLTDGGEGKNKEELHHEKTQPTVVRREFCVPGENDSMRIMFHSCNGFSVGTDEEKWSGPALWNDVIRGHRANPFHVMIGGGDQVYSDAIRVSGPLKKWAKVGNPHKRRTTPYTEKLSMEVNRWYRENYIEWYTTPPFSSANSRIPMVNIWDDHDIIDGYGSYTDKFMRCPMFVGIGKAAFRYYMAFQHHTNPNGEKEEDPSWVLGNTPGRYIGQRSRSLYCRLGRHVGLLGVDARSERTRRMINMNETYDLLFSRLEQECKQAPQDNNGIKHILVLLGVPIAYPRLVWLETILSSPVFGLLKFFNKRFGIAGSLFNKFDGSVDLLDDLDDHYTAHAHKHERNHLIHRLQTFSHEHSVRITLLSGDVHLAAIGRFYTRTRLKIPVENDHRYMVNVISSAITNKPPPAAVSQILAKRNKIHHLGHYTDERLLDFFDEDVDGKKRYNRFTMPRRNYAVITESHSVPPDPPNPGYFLPQNEQEDPTSSAPPTHHHTNKAENKELEKKSKSSTLPKKIPFLSNHPPDDRADVGIGGGEGGAGTHHAAVAATEGVPIPLPTPTSSSGSSYSSGDERDFLASNKQDTGPSKGKQRKEKSPKAVIPGTGVSSLNIAIRVEVNQHDREGHTKGFGFSIPVLESKSRVFKDGKGREVPVVDRSGERKREGRAK